VFSLVALAALSLEGVAVAGAPAIAGVGTVGAVSEWTFLLVAFVGVSLVALFDVWTDRAVRTARVSPLLSLGIGLAGLGGLAGLVLLGVYLTGQTLVGGVPILVPTALFGLAWSTVGFLALGTELGARLWTDNVVLGALLGAAVCALLLRLPLIVGGPALALVAALGVGASVRVSVAGGGVEDRDRHTPTAGHGLRR
jgi:hypothetical protein